MVPVSANARQAMMSAQTALSKAIPVLNKEVPSVPPLVMLRPHAWIDLARVTSVAAVKGMLGLRVEMPVCQPLVLPLLPMLVPPMEILTLCVQMTQQMVSIHVIAQTVSYGLRRAMEP